MYHLVTTYNFERNNIITPNCPYYKIIQLILRYENSTTLSLHKTKEDALKKQQFKPLDRVFPFFCRVTTYIFAQINIITLNYDHYKII